MQLMKGVDVYTYFFNQDQEFDEDAEIGFGQVGEEEEIQNKVVASIGAVENSSSELTVYSESA